MTPMPPSRAMAMAMPGLGDLVHRRRDEGHRQLDVAGEACGGVDGVGQHVAVARDDDDVVEGEGLEPIEQLVVCSCVDLLRYGGPAHRGESGDEQVVFGVVDRVR